MPAIILPVGGGVTLRDAHTALLALVGERVQEVRRELLNTLHGLHAVQARFTPARLPHLTAHEADAEFRNLDAQIEQLLKARTALQFRVDAFLIQQRAASQADLASADPFASPSHQVA